MIANETKEQLDEFHERQKTDANPKACVTANIREKIGGTHRWILREDFHACRFRDDFHRDVVPLNFIAPVARPIGRQRNRRFLDELLDDIRDGGRGCGHRRCRHREIRRRTRFGAVGAELIPDGIGVHNSISGIAMARTGGVTEWRFDRFIATGYGYGSRRPLKYIYAVTFLVAVTRESMLA